MKGGFMYIKSEKVIPMNLGSEDFDGLVSMLDDFEGGF
jgi:hypothetical protein